MKKRFFVAFVLKIRLVFAFLPSLNPVWVCVCLPSLISFPCENLPLCLRFALSLHVMNSCVSNQNGFMFGFLSNECVYIQTYKVLGNAQTHRQHADKGYSRTVAIEVAPPSPPPIHKNRMAKSNAASKNTPVTNVMKTIAQQNISLCHSALSCDAVLFFFRSSFVRIRKSMGFCFIFYCVTNTKSLHCSCVCSFYWNVGAR